MGIIKLPSNCCYDLNKVTEVEYWAQTAHNRSIRWIPFFPAVPKISPLESLPRLTRGRMVNSSRVSWPNSKTPWRTGWLVTNPVPSLPWPHDCTTFPGSTAVICGPVTEFEAKDVDRSDGSHLLPYPWRPSLLLPVLLPILWGIQKIPRTHRRKYSHTMERARVLESSCEWPPWWPGIAMLNRHE